MPKCYEMNKILLFQAYKYSILRNSIYGLCQKILTPLNLVEANSEDPFWDCQHDKLAALILTWSTGSNLPPWKISINLNE